MEELTNSNYRIFCSLTLLCQYAMRDYLYTAMPYMATSYLEDNLESNSNNITTYSTDTYTTDSTVGTPSQRERLKRSASVALDENSSSSFYSEKFPPGHQSPFVVMQRTYSLYNESGQSLFSVEEANDETFDFVKKIFLTRGSSDYALDQFDGGWSPAVQGLAISIFFIGSIFGLLLGRRVLIPKVGPIRTMSISLIGAGLMLIFTQAAELSGPGVISSLRFIQGIFFGCAWPAAYAVLESRPIGKRRPLLFFALASTYCGSCFGQLIGCTLGSLGAYVLAPAAFVLSAPMVFCDTKSPTQPLIPGAGAMLKCRAVQAVLASHLSLSYHLHTIMAALPPCLVYLYGQEATEAGLWSMLCVAVLGLSSLLSTAAGSRVVARVKRRRIIVLAASGLAIMCGIGLVASVEFGGAPALITVACVCCLSLGVLGASHCGNIAELAPLSLPHLAHVFNVAGQIPPAVVAIVVYVLGKDNSLGWTLSFTLPLILIAPTCIFYAACMSAERQPFDRPPEPLGTISMGVLPGTPGQPEDEAGSMKSLEIDTKSFFSARTGVASFHTAVSRKDHARTLSFGTINEEDNEAMHDVVASNADCQSVVTKGDEDCKSAIDDATSFKSFGDGVASSHAAHKPFGAIVSNGEQKNRTAEWLAAHEMMNTRGGEQGGRSTILAW